jgi:chromosome segregation ATPase
MINTHPSVAEIDATINLLSVLEMAKDATKLKDTLHSLKLRQDEIEQAKQAHDKAAYDAQQEAKKAEAVLAQVAVSQEKANRDLSNVAKGFADLEAARESMREERNKFDRWMAGEREALARRQSEVDSKAVTTSRLAEDIARREDALKATEERLAAAIAAADARRKEFDDKLASLKQMIN